MKQGDLLKRIRLQGYFDKECYEIESRNGRLALFVDHYESVNRVTGEVYRCAKVLWLKTMKTSTASYNIFEVISD